MARKDRAPIIVRKKVVGGHGHHGGAWKVAYADFVTAMMALFMVMWLLASTDTASRQEIARYFRTGVLEDGSMSMAKAAQVQPSVIEESGSPPRQYGMMVDRQTKMLREAIKQLVEADPAIAAIAAQVSVVDTPDGTLIEAIDKDGSESLLFNVSSSELKPALMQLLQGLGPVLQETGGAVEIIGHTDARPFVSKRGADNYTLSFERGDAARRILMKAGLTSKNIHGVLARADSQPYNAGNGLAAENRRLAILVRPPAAPVSPAAKGKAAPAAGPGLSVPGNLVAPRETAPAPGDKAGAEGKRGSKGEGADAAKPPAGAEGAAPAAPAHEGH